MDLVPIDWLRWIAIMTMIIVVVGGLYIIRKHFQSLHSSISEAIAQTPQSRLLMGTLLTVGGFIYYSFLAFWLVPYYDISPYGYLVIGLAFIAQLGMAWIPADKTKQNQQRMHFICGGTVAVSMIVFSTILLITSSQLSQLMQNFLFAYVLASAVYLAFFIIGRKNRLKYFLVFESIFVGVFAVIYGLLAIGIT